MNEYICKFCSSIRKSRKSLIAHEVFCKLNPNHKLPNTQLAREKAYTKYPCKWCNKQHSLSVLSKHQKSCSSNPEVIHIKTKECPICKKPFMSPSTTCSYSCSNSYFRHARKGGLRYRTDEDLVYDKRYRKLCFRYHKKECLVCGENKIVAVHHLNENHEDNRPENLIPLCPTHHLYMHSRFKNLIMGTINKYLETKSFQI